MSFLKCCLKADLISCKESLCPELWQYADIGLLILTIEAKQRMHDDTLLVEGQNSEDLGQSLTQSLMSNIILTVSEVAMMLKLPRSKVYLLIEEQLLDAFKLGAEWRIKTSSLEGLLE